MHRRCLYVPTEDGHCTNCGGFPTADGECPATGEPITREQSFDDAARAFGAALVSALHIPAILAFIGKLIERTADDDRA